MHHGHQHRYGKPLLTSLPEDQSPISGRRKNRQAVERFLVEQKGFDRDDIAVDAPIELNIAGEVYRSRIDLVVRVAGKRFMCIKCAAGSLGSRGAGDRCRSPASGPLPDPLCRGLRWKDRPRDGDRLRKKRSARGLTAIPAKDEAHAAPGRHAPLPPSPRSGATGESLIFRSYDSMDVNRIITLGS